MENATEALKMAAAVLIFVLAISITITAFGQARVSAKTILDYRDREYDYTYVDYDVEKTERIVSVETMIPTIYKAYKENYKIVFKDKNENGMKLYTKKAKKPDGTIGEIDVCSFDLQPESLANDQLKERFIRTLLYGTSKYSEDGIYFRNRDIYLPEEGIYGIIKKKTFKESLGVYYQEELEGQTDSPDANLTKKRVITYTETIE